MMGCLVICAFITILYTWNIVRFMLNAFGQVVSTNKASQTKVTVLVAARNEETNIARCIAALGAQDYPATLLEIMVVDDASEDNTVECARKALEEGGKNHNVMELKNTSLRGKKAAIEYGVDRAWGELVVCMDADSFPDSSDWLMNYVLAYEQSGAVLLAGPVAFDKGTGLLHTLQQLELLTLNLVSAGAVGLKRPLMCSGTNMAFNREAFLKCGGYEGNREVASGDDIFLLNKLWLMYPGKISYLNNRNQLVLTHAHEGLKAILQQRLRWAGKFRNNKNAFNFYIGLLTFFSAFTVVVAPFFAHNSSQLGKYLWPIVGVKIFIDILLLILAAVFYGQRRILWGLPVFIIINPLYVCLTALGGLFVQPIWKGRKV